MDNNLLAFINILFYLVAFIVLQSRTKHFGANSFILVLYLITAILGLFYINNTYAVNEELRLFPFIYLFAMLMLVFYPLYKINENKIEIIEPPSKKLFYYFCWLIIILKVVYLATALPEIGTNIMNMFSDSSTILDSYGESYERASMAGHRKFNFLAIFSNLFSNISIVVFMYYLTLQEKKTILTIGLLLGTLLTPIISLSYAQRGTTIIFLIQIICCYLLFRNFYSDKIKRITRVLLVLIFSALIIPFTIITITRFSDRGADYMAFNMLNYGGQSNILFNYYALDETKFREGTRTATLFTTILSEGSAPRNYTERLDKYHTSELDETRFSTFVGDFVLDYGPYATVLIFLISTVFFRKKLKITETIKFHDIILWFTLVNVCIGLFLFTFADWGGNINFIALFAFYYFFKYFGRLRFSFVQ